MKRYLICSCIFLIVLYVSGLQQCAFKNELAITADKEWPEYLGSGSRDHYSPLSQINKENVHKLKVAWQYNSGDSGQVQCNPLIIDRKLYGVTAYNHLFALDAKTGVELWRFVPDSSKAFNVNRGVTYWSDKDDKRILYAYQSWLYAVNAATGKLVTSFGDNGKVNLKSGLGDTAKDKYVASTTPGTLFNDLIIMPIRVAEGEGAAKGYIQAFNVKTGALKWVFKTIPEPGDLGYDTWPKEAYKNEAIGGANNWAGMAIDKQHGIVYIPIGSAAFDFYGGNRIGENLFANCLLVLDAATGKYLWHYQMVHHDIWDRDLPAPPNLVTLKVDGKVVEAVAQVTKTGHVFILDRLSGKPVFPIDEIPFPQSDLKGEQAWLTQPIPRSPKPFSRQGINEDEITRFSQYRDSLITIYRNARKGLYRPLDFKPTLLFPGADGGAEWGGAAVDKEGIMYINANEMPWLFSLSNKKKSNGTTSGRGLYVRYCASCHHADRSGTPASGFPSLIELKKKVDRPSVNTIIEKGKGMMPGFMLSNTERNSIINYLFGEEKEEIGTVTDSNETEIPYRFNGYNKFLDENGYPAITPPWGTLTAIDLNKGEHLWRIPLGEITELSEKGIPVTGTENYGGPIVTASGIIFIGATKDGMFRAIDKLNGKILWEYKLPAAAFATPSTYQIGSKQYIVLACGGTKLGTTKGDSYIAFSLP